MVTKSEGVGLVVRVISFQDFQPVITNHQCYRRTDGQTDGRHVIPIPRICTKVDRVHRFLLELNERLVKFIFKPVMLCVKDQMSSGLFTLQQDGY